jgi:hypothetical protein
MQGNQDQKAVFDFIFGTFPAAMCGYDCSWTAVWVD